MTNIELEPMNVMAINTVFFVDFIKVNITAKRQLFAYLLCGSSERSGHAEFNGRLCVFS